MPSIRVAQALEQLSEDGTLTGDLDDAAGGALLQWAEQQIVAAGAESDEDEFAALVAAVRQAVRSAARGGARSAAPATPDTVVAQAAALLRRSITQSTARPQVATPRVEPAPIGMATAPAANTPLPVVTADQPALFMASKGDAAADAVPSTLPPSTNRGSTWETVRRRIRRWMHRKA